MGITSGGFDLKYTLVDGKDGYIESTSSEIEDKDVSFTFGVFVETISDSSGSWLINDSLNG